MQTRRRLSLLFAVFVGSAGPTSVVLAQQILILPYQPLGKNVPAEITEQATVVVAKEMSSQGLSIVRGDDVPIPGAPGKASRRKEPETPSGDPSAGSRSEQLIAKAKQAVEEGEFVVAVRDLKTAVKLLEDNGDSVPDLRLLAEAYLQLGVAYFRNGDEDAGDEMLARAVHFDPERQLEEADYPNLFIRVFARARYNVLRRPRGALEVKGAKGSLVLLDGRPVGKTPLLLKEALPGAHWVRIERPGEPMQVRKIALKAGQSAVVDLDTGAQPAESDGPSLGLLAAIAENDLSREHVQQLKAVASKAGASAVLIGGIHKTETAYNLRTVIISVKDGSVGRLTDVAFDLDLLSAEIEAFKLAEDLKKELAASTRSRPVSEARFPVALGLKAKSERRDAQPESKVTTVIAAPPAPPAPQAAQIADAAPAETKKARAPSASSTTPGRQPVESAAAARSSREVVPKDEADAAPRVTTALTPSSITPVDEEEPERSEASTWWIWVLVGVAAVGAASAGGYLVATGGSPETGNLKITW